MGSEDCEDKVKLLLDDPEAPPSVSLKKNDYNKKSYPIWGFITSLVLFVLLIYVAWGTLMAFMDVQNQKQPGTILIAAESKSRCCVFLIMH